MNSEATFSQVRWSAAIRRSRDVFPGGGDPALLRSAPTAAATFSEFSGISPIAAALPVDGLNAVCYGAELGGRNARELGQFE